MSDIGDIEAAIELLLGIDPTLDPKGISRTVIPILEAIGPILEHEKEQEQQIAAANLRKETGDDEDVASDFLYAVFDQRDLVSRQKVKWYDPRTTIGDRTGKTRLTKKRGICFHHTAVFRGFGADKSIVARYLAMDMNLARFSSTSRDITQEEWARAMAIAHRFRGDPARKYNEGVPYHAIMGANSVLYLNLPFDWVTWHGNGSNTDFLGVAWDALSTREDPCAEDLIADCIHIVNTARLEAHPITELTVHAAWTNKTQDPGASFIREVMLPVADRTGCVIKFDFKADRRFRSIREILEAA